MPWLTGDGSGRVASLTSLCLEAMVAAWESHGVTSGGGGGRGGYLPGAYHMPHELCARLLRLLVSSKKLTAFTLSGTLSTGVTCVLQQEKVSFSACPSCLSFFRCGGLTIPRYSSVERKDVGAPFA